MSVGNATGPSGRGLGLFFTSEFPTLQISALKFILAVKRKFFLQVSKTLFELRRMLSVCFIKSVNCIGRHLHLVRLPKFIVFTPHRKLFQLLYLWPLKRITQFVYDRLPPLIDLKFFFTPFMFILRLWVHHIYISSIIHGHFNRESHNSLAVAQ